MESGAVVGKTVPNTGNSFLCTAKKYGDFILELEFKVDPSMNSGIQFRSNYYTQETEVEIAGKRRNFQPTACMVTSLKLTRAPAPSPVVCMMKAVAAGSLI
ncbi:hypothetical protein GCM10023213_29500 [Prosthecobacter algae]|uniref:3-keto-alpha-glucoside-1,2-lyase/3-keto-2-hydroxy-glucal hydratase domain-containing protein n=1 Tax=Prosthecobacter algae TaxID=1144682 RepID=A0ABP9PCT3_9BACT